ncbi:alpha-hydroxy acid oxidase [Tepidicella xavieri]|nr:alpha-hydroxy acid oxidase [Tepidicella xavieri]
MGRQLMHAQRAWPVNLADHETLARAHLTPEADAYFNGGAADEITMAANRQAWAAIPLWPRVLRLRAAPCLKTPLLGRTWPSPVLVAPMAQQGWLHPDAERATALAASALGAGMVLSMQANTPLEHIAQDVAQEPGRGPLWFQLYHLGNRGHTLALAQRAAEAGYEALVLTVDAPIHGVRDRERRHPGHPPRALAQPHMPTPASGAEGLDALLRQAATWEDVVWLQSRSPLPLLLKGILHPADARTACELGVAGVIVSNHGGRVLDTAPSTATALPLVADAVAGRAAVLVDGGLRRGTDILKALALGAHGVLVGRPVLHGLAHAGAQGAAHVLRLLQDELMAAMALCGLADIAAIDRACLQPQ